MDEVRTRLVVCDGMQDTVGMFLLVCLEDAVDFFVNVFRILDLDVSGDRSTPASIPFITSAQKMPRTGLTAVARSTIALPAI